MPLPLVLLAGAGLLIVWTLGILSLSTSLLTALAVGLIIVGLARFVRTPTIEPVTLLVVGVGFAVLFMGDIVDSLTIGETLTIAGDTAASIVGRD